MELLKPLADTVFPAATVSYTGTAGSTSTWAAGPQGVVYLVNNPCLRCSRRRRYRYYRQHPHSSFYTHSVCCA
jgi:hypothetical protein